MKRLITLLALLPAASLTFGQAITITAADAPVPTGPYALYRYDTGPISNPAVSTSASWDFSTVTGIETAADYYPETDAFFTSAGTDVHTDGVEKYLNSSMVYYFNSKIDFNSSGVFENGIEIPEQLYDISAITGMAGDSLNIPAQEYIVTTPKQILAYPLTANTSWFTNGRHVTNFKLTVGAAGLTNAPSEHVYYTYRKDSIAGWGKMKIYTPSGPSPEVDVLMNKSIEYNVDSFYIGGSPAPASILAGFGITQGQITDASHRYMFLRKGSFMYLAAFLYEGDNTFTTASTYFYSKDINPTGTKLIDNNTYSTVLFPNPATGNEINMMISGHAVTVDEYTITDMLGRVVKSGKANLKQNMINIPLDNNLPGGAYILSVSDKDKIVATQQFSIKR